jgi:hypothetical protein
MLEGILLAVAGGGGGRGGGVAETGGVVIGHCRLEWDWHSAKSVRCRTTIAVAPSRGCVAENFENETFVTAFRVNSERGACRALFAFQAQ